MFDTPVCLPRSCLLVLAGCLAAGAVASARAADTSLKSATTKVDDLTVTELKIPGKATLPCMLWADPQGTAFFTLEGGTGVLKRISFPACKIEKQKDFERKFTWMSNSEYGLLLSEGDSEEIWVVDQTTLEMKNKIPVPKLKRAVSAPGLAVAVACDRGTPLQDQKLYIVDLRQKSAVAFTPPANMSREIGLNNPAMSPDGAFVFTQGDYVTGHMCRFSLKDGKLKFEEAQEQIGDVRYQMGGNTPDNSAGITISSDSKFVAQVFPGGHVIKTPIYPVDSFAKHECTLEHGPEKTYPGYRPLEKPMALGFDIKGGYIYTQSDGQEFTIFTLTGVMKKEYKAGFGSVRQFLVHPEGNQVILLREAAVDAGMGRLIHSDTVLIEVPKKK
jgi:hypothetical protein